jgi:carboxylesterase type B
LANQREGNLFLWIYFAFQLCRNLIFRLFGSVSISLHLLMEGSQNLFRRVAMESASAFQDSASGVTAQAPYQLSTYKAYSKAWLAECNCTTVACARALPKETLLAVQLAHFPDWKPQIDGTIITDDPLVLLRAGKFQKNVDILYGNNADEGTLFVNLSYTADDMVKATQEMFGSKNAEKILKQYSSGYDSPGYAFAAIYGDYLMNCPGRRMLRTVAKQSPSSRLYQFEWRHLPSWIRCPGIFCKGPAGVPQRVAHFTEIAFVFGVANPWPAPAPAGYNMTDAEATLSAYMRGAWVQFASTGSMNADWPPYTDSGAYMPLQTLMPRPIEYNYDQSNCDMWDALSAASTRDTDYTLWYSIGAGVLVLIIAIVVRRRRAASNSREGLLSASIQETDNYRPLTH